VVPGDENYRGVGKGLSETLELPERKDNGVIAGPDGMEEIARHDDCVRSRGNDAVNSSSKGLSNIGLPLINACRGLPVVLPDAEVGVRDVGQFHG
jgi:hypothetical protein